MMVTFLFHTPLMAAPLKVVTSFSILADMTKEVGGEWIDVKPIVGPNQDTHVYEPRPSDLKNVAQADLIIINGLGFEGWIERLTQSSGYQKEVAVATQGLQPHRMNHDGQEVPDPHAWHSPQNALIYVENISNALQKVIPEHAADIQKRATSYQEKIKVLDQEMKDTFSIIPIEKRKVITAHDGFGYLGQDYDITFLAPLGISTDSEPSAHQLAVLIKQIHHEGIKAIFIENISNPRLLEQMASEAGVSLQGVLYSDALSAPGTEADTYLKMMHHNIGVLKKAFTVNLSQ
ncbi:metal ABC transporter substrate-binding protein [Candidatus Bealeia paramacronuclearis]